MKIKRSLRFLPKSKIQICSPSRMWPSRWIGSRFVNPISVEIPTNAIPTAAPMELSFGMILNP